MFGRARIGCDLVGHGWRTRQTMSLQTIFLLCGRADSISARNFQPTLPRRGRSFRDMDARSATTAGFTRKCPPVLPVARKKSSLVYPKLLER